jgi:hypothetical protein
VELGTVTHFESDQSERTGRIEREPGTGRKIVIRMREGAGNGNGNTGNGTGPGHKRRAGKNGNASTVNDSGNGRSRASSGVPGPDDVSAGPAPEAAAFSGNGTAVHGSAAVHGPGVHVPDPSPASDRVPVPATVPAVPVPAKGDRITLLIVLAIATVSAGFSIYGWTNIYGGAFWQVIAMGVVLECGKLRAITLIGMGRGASWVRLLLVAAVLALMGFNAVGAFGFLTEAHIAHQVESKTAVAQRIVEIDGRIAAQDATLAAIDKQLGQIDGAINKTVDKGRPNAAMALANDQRHNRSLLEVDRKAAGEVLTKLKVEKAGIEGERDKVEKAGIEGERDKVEADLGPVRDLAALIGGNDHDVLRRFTLVISLLLDPLAVLLLLAASTRSASHRCRPWLPRIAEDALVSPF